MVAEGPAPTFAETETGATAADAPMGITWVPMERLALVATAISPLCQVV